ncbi:hypothetical protein EVAR_9790_1 [Eumeta japonica]|uniref:Uncharacterized protein n=1 Tax=Eumeta variegata TaxID=151549 RepID=A0A4C1U5H5_EUMVA|nr:hypothetical protein EVAR_9790_1 [Eumeta japonica]
MTSAPGPSPAPVVIGPAAGPPRLSAGAPAVSKSEGPALESRSRRHVPVSELKKQEMQDIGMALLTSWTSVCTGRRDWTFH